MPAHLRQAIWRGDFGYTRDIPLSLDGTPNWGQATIWSSPIALSGFRGSGEMQSFSALVYASGQILRQSYWRSNFNWVREVGITNGVPNFGDPRGFGTLTFTLPGSSGDIQAENAYIYPNGLTLRQTIWRGNQGWLRDVPIGPDGSPNWGAAGNWMGPVQIADLPPLPPRTGDMQTFTAYPVVKWPRPLGG